MALVGIVLFGTVGTVSALHFLQPDKTRAQAEIKASPTPTPTLINQGYEWYTPDTLAQAQAKGRTFLLFWVPWCSSCSALDVELERRSAELPPDVTVLKINMDHDKSLLSKYGVTIQHTLVEIDAQGNEVQKWVGGDFNTLTTHL